MKSTQQQPQQPRAARSLALLGSVLLGSMRAATAYQIVVATPANSKEAGETFGLAFAYTDSGGTTGDLTSFDIELRSHDNADATTGCGDEALASLCTREAAGVCSDSDGSYDVQIPEDAEAGKYSIKIMLADDDSAYACTNAFNVTRPTGEDGVAILAGEASVGEVEVEAASSTYLEQGEAFTSRWVYDDGGGAGGGTFEINLNACGDDGACENGGCGTFSTALCGDAGCYDPGTGDYDVTVPADQAVGEYKLEVVSANDTDVSSCTASSFFVVEVGGAPSVSPTETPVDETPAPSPPPLPTFAPVAPTPAPVTAAPVAAPVASSSSSEPGSPGFPPTPVPDKVVCDDTAELSFVYTLEDTKRPLVTVAHASGDRSEAGCLTLTKLYDWLATEPADVPTGMLLTVDSTTETAVSGTTATPTGIWLLDTSVVITNGVTFEIKGTSIGGDCDELKFSSTKKAWNRIMGHGGNIDIESTVVRSWDASKTLEHILKDADDGTTNRSFISCVSEVVIDADETCDGTAQNDMGECRMDIIDSTVAYLGYEETESYGISWKVRGLCDDLSNKDTLFESVRVYGDMKNSDIYGMWYGHYSYGHLGGVWTNNLMHDNHVYGFDPHDDSDYLTISGNTCYNNGNHGIIASKRCDHLLVENNESYDNGGSGIMLHKSCDDSIVRGNTVYSNGDAGLSLVETSNCVVSDNEFTDNRWGFRVILGSTGNVLDSNILTENTYSDIYSYYGADEEVPEVEPFTGINTDNTYSNNVVTHLVKTTVDIEDSDGTVISGNAFSGNDNGAHFVFLNSDNTHVVDNTGDAASGESDDITNSCFTAESNRAPVC
ncbi:MEP19 [Ectocarpus sp. CCAP 1310/34]|nr:MEP19 [Ectocarpus sp. CCAP 1310/34]